VLSVILELDRCGFKKVGGCYLAAPKLAAQCGLHEKVVALLRQELEAIGLLVRRGGHPHGGTLSYWFVALPDEVEDQPPANAKPPECESWRITQVARFDEVIRQRRADIAPSRISGGSAAVSCDEPSRNSGADPQESPRGQSANPQEGLPRPSRNSGGLAPLSDSLPNVLGPPNDPSPSASVTLNSSITKECDTGKYDSPVFNQVQPHVTKSRQTEEEKRRQFLDGVWGPNRHRRDGRVSPRTDRSEDR